MVRTRCGIIDADARPNQGGISPPTDSINLESGCWGCISISAPRVLSSRLPGGSATLAPWPPPTSLSHRLPHALCADGEAFQTIAAPGFGDEKLWLMRVGFNFLPQLPHQNPKRL